MICSQSELAEVHKVNKPGTVYMLQEGPYIKLGYSSQTPWDRRLHQIRNASPREIVVLAARPATYEQEQDLHRGAEQWKHKGDWYNDCAELRRYCDAFFYPDAALEQPISDLPAGVDSAGDPETLSQSEPEVVQQTSEFD